MCFSDSSCNWTPLVMLYHEGLSRNHVQLKFSNPQNDSDILFYVVNLLDSSGTKVDELKIPANIKNNMIFCEFQSVKSGYYSILISLVLSEESCIIFKSDLKKPFLVGAEVRGNFFSFFLCKILLFHFYFISFVEECKQS